MSPTPASGSRLRWAPKPKGSIMKRDLAPLLSAQLSTAPTGRPSVSLNFVPAAPPPDGMLINAVEDGDDEQTFCCHFVRIESKETGLVGKLMYSCK